MIVRRKEGATDTQHNESDQLRKFLTYRLTILLACTGFVYTCLFFYMQNLMLAIPGLCISLSLTSCVFLLRKGYILPAKTWLILCTNTAIYYYALVLGKQAGIQHFFFAIPVIPFVMFPPKQRLHIFASVLFSVLGYFGTELEVLPDLLPLQLSAMPYLSMVNYLTIVMTFVIVCIGLYIYSNAEENQASQLAQQAIELEKKLKLEKDLIRGGQVQQLVLPQDKPTELYLDVCYKPARILSGDFWYWHYIGPENRKIFLLAVDIQGKGIGAALPTIAFATLLKDYLNQYSKNLSSLQEIMEFIQTKLMMTEALSRKSVACVGYLIDLESTTFQYINAGMEEIAHFVHQGKTTILPCLNMALGFEENPLQTITYSYTTGDRIFLGSDGLKDTLNTEGHHFGEDALNQLVSQTLYHQKESILPTILNKLEIYQKNAEQTDDITMMLLEFN